MTRGANSPRSDSIAPFSFSTFSAQIASECINGSAIAPVLFEAAIALVTDTETFAGGDVAYPIHEALNWHVTRFGYQSRPTLYAALWLNADGSTWQAKLSQPRTDANGKCNSSNANSRIPATCASTGAICRS